MTEWQKTLVGPETTMLEAIRNIDQSVLQIALVVDADRRLLGSVTDGDIRRGILKGLAMESPIVDVMNQKPLTVSHDTDVNDLKATMAHRGIHQVPVIDGAGKVIDLVVIDDLIRKGGVRNNWVILMAGGQGTRLRPLTETTPKPLVKVGGKPLLESIIENFVRQGFAKFQISVNYLGDQIKSHFQDGGKWGAEIRYIDENEPLGTAGALSLLESIPDEPVVVMNCDLMTDIDFSKMLDFHRDRGALATMAVREYDLQVQFGVVNVAESAITSIDEKPVHRFLVNAGIYVLENDALARIPKNTPIDMPTLFGQWIAEGHTCGAFPIHEYWLDVGRVEDLGHADRWARDHRQEPSQSS